MEWEAAERLRTLRSSVLEVLGARFSQQIPIALVQSVEKQEDAAVLGKWLRIAAVVSSPEAMSAAIAANGH